MMRIHRYVTHTTAEGPGQRFCLWMQGCCHHCEGCFNPETWSFDGGTEMTGQQVLEKILAVRNQIEGITLLGGEPFHQARELAWLCKHVREAGLSVLAFTGYTYEALQGRHDPDINALLAQIDLLLDGPYIQALQDFSRPWVGSSNQRFVYLTDRYHPAEIAACKNRLEVRLAGDGSLIINGMAPPEILENVINTLTQQKAVQQEKEKNP